ncbi:MAG: ATP-binding cassette domain-containing protein, partial [Hungatella sp.]
MAELTTHHIAKQFDGKTIIEDVNITLHEHEIVCILGMSGVGKTTLFNIISGLVRPDEGEVFLDGID